MKLFQNPLRRDIDQALVIALRRIAFTHFVITRNETNHPPYETAVA